MNAEGVTFLQQHDACKAIVLVPEVDAGDAAVVVAGFAREQVSMSGYVR